MKRTLFEISDDLLSLSNILDEVGGDITDEQAEAAIDGWLAELGAERDQKLDGYAYLITELQARGNALGEESARLAAAAKAQANQAARLKARLKMFMEVQGLAKITTPAHTLAIQTNGGKAPLILPELWRDEPAAAPEAFHRHRIELDTDAIRAALESGTEIDGCAIGQRGTQLRIR